MAIDKCELKNRKWRKPPFPIGSEVMCRCKEGTEGAISDDNGVNLLSYKGFEYDILPVPKGYHGACYVQEGSIKAVPLGVEPGESAISSLAISSNGRLYGATSGRRAHIFCYSAKQDSINLLDAIDAAVERCTLAQLSDNQMFIATKPETGSGCIYQIDPESANPKIKTLCRPVEGEGISTLVADRDKNILYGLSSVTGSLFTVDPADGSINIKGSVDNQGLFSRNMAIGPDGTIYGGMRWTTLFAYSAINNQITKPACKAPTLAGREMYNRLDALVCSGDSIYGGTSADGILFRFDPREEQMIALGKPLNQPRIRCLVFAQDGCLYGIAGDKCCHLFRYNSLNGDLRDLGILRITNPYLWHGYQFSAMAAGFGGEIYIGESDYISHLFIYCQN